MYRYGMRLENILKYLRYLFQIAFAVICPRIRLKLTFWKEKASGIYCKTPSNPGAIYQADLSRQPLQNLNTLQKVNIGIRKLLRLLSGTNETILDVNIGIV